MWQPIETAPKDGGNILIYVPPFDHGPAAVAVVHWQPPAYGRAQGAWAVTHGESGLDEWRPDDPTHWMPLPISPENPA